MRNPRENALPRREFLQSMSAAAAATLALGEPRLRAAESSGSVKHPPATADACILLWMAGGMAAPETFDPKRYAPFEVGVPAEKILCTFPAIDTVVDNIKISQGLEHVAKVMDRGTLIRSHVVADLGNILHSRHQYHWHTGYVPPQTVAAPHLGAWIARVRGPRNPAIPAFINIGQRLEGVGESGGAEGVHHRRLPRQRVRPVQPARIPHDAADARPAAEGHDRRALRRPATQRYQGAAEAQPGRRDWPATTTRSRCCGRWRTPTGCSARRSARRSTWREEPKESLRAVQHRPLRPGLPAGPAAGRGGRRGSSR